MTEHLIGGPHKSCKYEIQSRWPIVRIMTDNVIYVNGWNDYAILSWMMEIYSQVISDECRLDAHWCRVL